MPDRGSASDEEESLGTNEVPAARPAAGPVMPDGDDTRRPERPRNLRAALQERWDSNPVLVAIGLALSGATLMLTIVAPIVGWIRDNDLAAANNRLEVQRLEHERVVSQYEDQVADLQESLSSIVLTLGPETDYFDVGALVVRRETRTEVPAAAASYDGGMFFAPAADDPWTYDQVPELRYQAELLGLTDDELRNALRELFIAQGIAPEEVDRVLDGVASFEVHRWRLSGEKRVAWEGLNLNVPTQVIVQRVDHDRYLDLIFGPAQSAADDDARRDLYSRDQSGWILQSQMLAQNIGGQPPLINTLQKKGQVAYAAVEIPLLNVTVNGVEHAEYTLHQDWLIISTPTDAYLIRRLVADEGRSTDTGSLNQWLQNFRVCENC